MTEANVRSERSFSTSRMRVPGDHHRYTGGREVFMKQFTATSTLYGREKEGDDGNMRKEDSEVLGFRWLLLRHGQTDYNAAGRVQGSSDTSRLSEEGQMQAREVGKFLGTLNIDYVYVSPLSRAQDTLKEAEEAAGKTFADTKVVVNDLREVDLHEWEGLYKKAIKEQWPDTYELWRGKNPEEMQLASGRYPIRDLWQRAAAVWGQLLADAASHQGTGGMARKRTTLITGHNGINQALLATALGLPEKAFRKFEFPNCGVVEIVWKPGQERACMWRYLYPTVSEWMTTQETEGVIEAAYRGGI